MPLLEHCTSLQHLQLVNNPHYSDYVDSSGPARAVVGQGFGACLTQLRLEHIACSLLDLHLAPCLTSLQLHYLDVRQALPLQLSLPSSLLRFSFQGSSFFTPQKRLLLANLPCLAKITICVADLKWLPAYRLPTLPCSLQHPQIHCWDYQQCLMAPNATHTFAFDLCDWQLLDDCTNLTRLTLPIEYHASGRYDILKVKLRDLSCVHIIDYSDHLDFDN